MIKIGDRVTLTEQAKNIVGLREDFEFVVKDILKGDVKYLIVLSCEEFGEDWVQFFKKEEIIKL